MINSCKLKILIILKQKKKKMVEFIIVTKVEEVGNVCILD